MKRLTLNILWSLIIQSKVTVRGIRFILKYALPFAAKHILNLVEAIDVSYEDKPKKRAKMLIKLGLTSLWYGGYVWHDLNDIYRLIGKICGDYKNIASDNFVYHRTVLDCLLDMIRDYDSYNTAENVILTMSLVRACLVSPRARHFGKICRLLR